MNTTKEDKKEKSFCRDKYHFADVNFHFADANWEKPILRRIFFAEAKK